MRLIDENGNDIREEDCDLSKGEIIEKDYVSPEAYDSIDNVNKFAIDDDDVEHVRMYRRYTELDYLAKEHGAKLDAREELMDELPDTLSDIDDAICTLYEMTIGE